MIVNGNIIVLYTSKTVTLLDYGFLSINVDSKTYIKILVLNSTFFKG